MLALPGKIDNFLILVPLFLEPDSIILGMHHVYKITFYINGYRNVLSRPAATMLPRSLLEKEIASPHPRLTVRSRAQAPALGVLARPCSGPPTDSNAHCTSLRTSPTPSQSRSGRWRRPWAACATDQQSSNSKTPRSGSPCLTGSSLASSSDTSPPRGPMTSIRCRASRSLVCTNKLLGGKNRTTAPQHQHIF